MLSLDGRNLAMIGGVAAAVIAGIYVIWGPSENRRQKRHRRVICPGLVNLGNTCFMNAVLQALAPCLSVQHWLTNLAQMKHSSTQYLATTLHNVIKVLNNDSVEFKEEYSLTDVIRSLTTHGWVISPEEQDAHEMFHVLTETLNDETSQRTNVTSLFDVTTLQEEGTMSPSDARNRIGTDLPVLEKSDADNPFRGLLASQLRCKRCTFSFSVKYDHFDSLSLSIPAQYIGPLTLDGLLKHYIMPETVDGVYCEKCNIDHSTPDVKEVKPATFVKQLTIGKLPRCLCIHVQRTSWLSGGVPTKRFDQVSFPEVLSMSPYIYRKKETHISRPKTLDLFDGGASGMRLVGGRKQPNGINQSNFSRASKATSPTMTVPYSAPVNMLKALNYHTRLTQSGLSALGPLEKSDLDNRQVRRLAHAYSTETLAMNAPPGWVTSTDVSSSYKLVAVVVHLGDASSGHFVTYRRAPSLDGQRFPAQWLYTSDVVVTTATLATVLAADAYMLFYEKI